MNTHPQHPNHPRQHTIGYRVLERLMRELKSKATVDRPESDERNSQEEMSIRKRRAAASASEPHMLQ